MHISPVTGGDVVCRVDADPLEGGTALDQARSFHNQRTVSRLRLNPSATSTIMDHAFRCLDDDASTTVMASTIAEKACREGLGGSGRRDSASVG